MDTLTMKPIIKESITGIPITFEAMLQNPYVLNGSLELHLATTLQDVRNYCRQIPTGSYMKFDAVCHGIGFDGRMWALALLRPDLSDQERSSLRGMLMDSIERDPELSAKILTRLICSGPSLSTGIPPSQAPPIISNAEPTVIEDETKEERKKMDESDEVVEDKIIGGIGIDLNTPI